MRQFQNSFDGTEIIKYIQIQQRSFCPFKVITNAFKRGRNNQHFSVYYGGLYNSDSKTSYVELIKYLGLQPYFFKFCYNIFLSQT